MKTFAFSLFCIFGLLTGLCHSAEPLKNARWITGGYPEASGRRVVPVFKKTFDLTQKIRSAKLYITALGIYEARLNGKRIGKDYFAPGFTVYGKRLQYQEYEVAGHLRKGQNTLEVLVGEGWYRGTFRNLISDTVSNNFGVLPGLLAELKIMDIETEASNSSDNKAFSGSRLNIGTSIHLQYKTLVATDSSWKCAKSGISYSEIYDGESFDSGYVINSWKPVKLFQPRIQTLIPNASEPVRKQETFRLIRFFITPKGEQVIDFGQNIAGWVELKIKGRAGDTIRLSHAEILDSLGNFYTGNLRTAKATDTYILNGKSQTLEPHFTYHGFRYVKVEGVSLSTKSYRAIALYSDLKQTGTFSCSSPMLNQLQHNIEWSMKGNFLDIPTDCPQRSERLGWTGDAQVFAGTASYLRNTKAFYTKWLEDLALEQGQNGAVPNFVPTSSPYRNEVYGVAGWGDAATIIPWRLYEVYGDTLLLARHYPAMKKWVDYITSVSHSGLWMNKGYGDWYAMGDSTSIPFINQCYYAHSTGLVAKAAKVLGHFDDAGNYSSLLQDIKARFMERYGRFDSKATSTQTAYTLTLVFGLLPNDQRQPVAEKLAEKVRANGNKLATGFLGTPHLLQALSDYGHTQLAYQLLFQRECPSWLYPISKGATTIWERWDAVRPDGTLQETSFNHYAYGAVGQWMYEHILGVSSTEPGYRRVSIRPEIGGGLTWARGSYQSAYGEIIVFWSLKGKKFVLQVELPEAVNAEIYLPGCRSPKIVTGGSHKLISKQDQINTK